MTTTVWNADRRRYYGTGLWATQTFLRVHDCAREERFGLTFAANGLLIRH